MFSKNICVSLVQGYYKPTRNSMQQQLCNSASMFLTDAHFPFFSCNREQLILEHGAAATAIKIEHMEQGIYFFFSNCGRAVKFVDFIGEVAPAKSRNDKQLVCHDPKYNYYNYKCTFSVEISPVCHEDLICLPPNIAKSLGNLGPPVICTKLVENVVLDVDIIFLAPVNEGGGSKYTLAYVQVARVSDFGKNDTIFNITTYLGSFLNPGDYALGYDLYGVNGNDIELDKYKGLDLPDAILIKKISFYNNREYQQPLEIASISTEVNVELEESFDELDIA
ncbi:hypothetical protein FEM48_Zijuj03G0176800 [Ziziphus jujuba var. spinosa]|uniref:60S ribosomal export protein NMD3 n=1 Tax=Ziziphus jujuba var. spinosa TaxID=714518 RepID=A0A978VRQ3_ZIZJJ|nr:hypothetical protein FEM48_Zijuj03G0176800 [Ziziphus jujuba var. spinosa]